MSNEEKLEDNLISDGEAIYIETKKKIAKKTKSSNKSKIFNIYNFF